MSARHRPHPHLAIPPGAAPPTSASPRHVEDWDFLVTPPDNDTLDLWNDDYRHETYTPLSPDSATPNTRFSLSGSSPRSASRPSSVHESNSSRLAFPEPHPYRSGLRPSASFSHLGHRSTKSETYLQLSSRQSQHRGESRPPSFISTESSSPEFASTVLSDELSNLTLDSEEALRQFQAGQLNENDEEWYRLVPPEAREVLDKKEVQRQSVLFEMIKSERDYVRDLELVQEVFVDPLLNTSPMPQDRVKGFVSEVFYNLDKILVHHRRMLDKLFERQRDQHPLLQSVADIVLDTSLAFRQPYESYIKHYPLAEAHHRKELKRNPKYQFFLSQCSQDPRVRKRDLGTFLSRPVTRLPRLNLLLESAKKCTALDHPDQETLPLILSLLSEFIKSTQPGIEAAEGKVKFWSLCESLVYQRGEIIDLDLYDESRTLLCGSQLARRYKAEVGYSWADLYVALLDNYLLLLKPEVRPSGIVKHSVVSRPIPLEYLCFQSFDAIPENRKEKAHSLTEQGRLFDSFRSRYRLMYPFTIYHASAMQHRRYTLYANSEAERERWRKALEDAIAVRKARQEANMWFAPHTVNDGFFRVNGASSSSNSRITGKIKCAAPLTSGGKNLIAVGCPGGIYVAPRGSNDFKRVLKMTGIVSLHAIQDFNKVLVHSDEGLDAYSLDIMARVGLGLSRPQDLDASRERISGQDVAVMFARVERVERRTIVLYATKSFLQVTLHSLEALNHAEMPTTPRRSIATGTISFRPFTEQAWIPKDSHDISPLHHKMIGICTERGIHVVDPTNLSASSSNALVIPTYSDPSEPMQALKQRCAGARPLGLVKVREKGRPSEELLVIFDELGCYINRKGVPCRSSGYLRWETKATSFALRGDHILLFSSNFIEVRAVNTGRLVQVIEGVDIRLVHRSERAVFVGMKSLSGRDAASSNGVNGVNGEETDMLVELIETAELSSLLLQKQSSKAEEAGLWDEWDM